MVTLIICTSKCMQKNACNSDIIELTANRLCSFACFLPTRLKQSLLALRLLTWKAPSLLASTSIFWGFLRCTEPGVGWWSWTAFWVLWIMTYVCWYKSVLHNPYLTMCYRSWSNSSKTPCRLPFWARMLFAYFYNEVIYFILVQYPSFPNILIIFLLKQVCRH